jgi:hypothetical protein
LLQKYVNNTTTRALAIIVLIYTHTHIIATLVVAGIFAATSSSSSALSYKKVARIAEIRIDYSYRPGNPD